MAQHGFGLYIFDSENRLYLVRKPKSVFSENGKKWLVPGETYEDPISSDKQDELIDQVLESETPIDTSGGTRHRSMYSLGYWRHRDGGAEFFFDNFVIILPETFDSMKKHGRLRKRGISGDHFSLLELPVHEISPLTKDFFRSALFHSGTFIPSPARNEERRQFSEALADDSKRFFLIKSVGSGGYGRVYLVLDIATLLPRAVKAASLNPRDPSSLDRFVQEGKTLLILLRKKVSNVEEIFSINRVDDMRFYLQKEYIKGATLDKCRDRVSNDGLHTVIISAVVKTLQQVHKLGICHRDIKPNNIMVEFPNGSGPKVTLIDFGLAKYARPEPTGSELTAQSFRTGSPLWQSLMTFKNYSQHTALDDYYSVLHVYYWLIHGKTYYEAVVLNEPGPIIQQVMKLKSEVRDPFLDEDVAVTLRDHHTDCPHTPQYLAFHERLREAYAKVYTIANGTIGPTEKDPNKHQEHVKTFCAKILDVFE